MVHVKEIFEFYAINREKIPTMTSILGGGHVPHTTTFPSIIYLPEICVTNLYT